MKPVVFRNSILLSGWRKKTNGSVGFVPTMGALHAGHESLLQRARQENDITVLSIFVNPTQFNDPKDFQNYPQTWENDIALAEKHKVDVIFYPAADDLYPDSYSYMIKENILSQTMEGAHRAGHFEGMLTVVMKLFNLIKPTRAYFGEKDYQQLELVRGMTKAFFIDAEICAVPTLRAESGLALSSRNQLLNNSQQILASNIYKTITAAPSASEARKVLESLGLKVDYVEDLKNRRFVAAYIGDVRLIDNVEL
jgi:pantoate--beta-alanine ligase